MFSIQASKFRFRRGVYITPPTAKTLTYNGNNQDLVVAGKCPYGVLEYTMDGRANTSTTENWTTYNGNNWYTLNGSNNTGWSKTIPQGIYAGQYKIYWRVDADQNHYDYTNHPNSDNIDKVDVTIQRAAQNITLDSYNVTFCYHNISREFNVTGRYEDAVFAPLTVTGTVSASQNDTKITVYSSDAYGTGTGVVTVNTKETANYQAGSVTFTANITDHKWVETNVNSSNASQWPGCNNSSETHSKCWPWPDCTNTGFRHEICNYGCEAKRNVTLSPNPHRFSSSVIRSATCTEGGITRYRCACGYYYDVSGRPGATGHSWMWADTSLSMAYCQGICVTCRARGIVTEKEVAHSWSGTSYSGCCHWSKRCTRCGGGRSGGYSSHHGMKKYTKSKKWDIWAKKYVYTYGYKCHCGYKT